MNGNKKVKRLARERAARTGESYTTALAHELRASERIGVTDPNEAECAAGFECTEEPEATEAAAGETGPVADTSSPPRPDPERTPEVAQGTPPEPAGAEPVLDGGTAALASAGYTVRHKAVCTLTRLPDARLPLRAKLVLDDQSLTRILRNYKSNLASVVRHAVSGDPKGASPTVVREQVAIMRRAAAMFADDTTSSFRASLLRQLVTEDWRGLVVMWPEGHRLDLYTARFKASGSAFRGFLRLAAPLPDRVCGQASEVIRRLMVLCDGLAGSDVVDPGKVGGAAVTFADVVDAACMLRGAVDAAAAEGTSALVTAAGAAHASLVEIEREAQQARRPPDLRWGQAGLFEGHREMCNRELPSIRGLVDEMRATVTLVALVRECGEPAEPPAEEAGAKDERPAVPVGSDAWPGVRVFYRPPVFIP
jgi:hypothetical protein